jgi:hypothetical protein
LPVGKSAEDQLRLVAREGVGFVKDGCSESSGRKPVLVPPAQHRRPRSGPKEDRVARGSAGSRLALDWPFQLDHLRARCRLLRIEGRLQNLLAFSFCLNCL